MKKIFLCVLVLLAFEQAFAQKPSIDTSVYGKLAAFGGCEVSPNGTYTVYQVNNQPFANMTSIFIRTIATGKEKVFRFSESVNLFDRNKSLTRENFSFDSRYLFIPMPKDSLAVFDLKKGSTNHFAHIIAWQLFRSGKVSWLALKTDSGDKPLFLTAISGKEKYTFTGISNFQFAPASNGLLLDKEITKDSSDLIWVDHNTLSQQTIWHGQKIVNRAIFSPDGNSLVFTGIRDGRKAVWLYAAGEVQAIPLILSINGQEINGDSLQLTNFDHTNNLLFFKWIKLINKIKSNPALASVDVYSYKDAKIPALQKAENPDNLQNPENGFTCVYNVKTRKTFRLQFEHDRIKTRPLIGDLLLVDNVGSGDSRTEWFWNPKAQESVYLVSTMDGSRTCIGKEQSIRTTWSYSLSPYDNYAVSWDANSCAYMSYEVSTGKKFNITRGIKVQLTDTFGDTRGNGQKDSSYSYVGIAGWLKDSTAVWLRSKYGIIQADLTGKMPPIEITGNYGEHHHMHFDLFPFSDGRIIDPDKPVLLHFVSQDTKDEGFCTARAGRENAPVILSQFPMRVTSVYQGGNENNNGKLSILGMEDEQHPKNIYFTKDYKTFTRVSNIAPQLKYNWLTAELIHWNLSNGKSTQGILYKPENFDPNRKYPIIFFYYEQRSGQLHVFPKPELSSGELDISTYVSNGYLVFVPDIYYTLGHPGKSTLDAINGAADKMAQVPYVDTLHMGLEGMSWGGYETNYVITHSHRFAAAVSVAGLSDLLSIYGELNSAGHTGQLNDEVAQSRLGATPWERPDLYRENSPIMKVDQVTTPVLFMANKKDDAVPYEQGFELFLDLRRLGKKAWLLQYDNGDHGVYDDTDKKDWTIRMQQFFDYFLKEKSAPKWLADGLPSSLKQVDNGLEPSMSGQKP